MTTQKLATGAIVAIVLTGLLLLQTTAGQIRATRTISLSGTIIAPTTRAIAVVQGNARGTTNSATLTVIMAQTPTAGNLLILCFGSDVGGYATVSSISQTGVIWAKQVQSKAYGWWDSEIWAGVVGSGASTTVTINLSQVSTYGAVGVICEYSGLATSSFLDQTATSSGSPTGSSFSTATGTTAMTSQANELWIGTISAQVSNTGQSSPTNGFTLLDGAVYGGTMSLAYLENIVSTVGTASTGTTILTTTSSSNVYVGCIATFSATAGAIIVTPSNGIGINNLILGAQLPTIYPLPKPYDFAIDNAGQALMSDAGIKLVRVFDNDLDPIGNSFVLSWNETTHTGTYNWTVVDPVIQAIFASGAQPLIVLMSNMATSAINGNSVFTNGMTNDSAMGGLPSPADAASYATAWVTHMQAEGFPVKYYEIGNEIYAGSLTGWLFQDTSGIWQDPLDSHEQILARDFATVYNASVTAMKQVNPAISASFDFSWNHAMMTWWLANYTGAPLDRIDFHFYASGTTGSYTDSELFQMAQTLTETGGGTNFRSGSNPILAQQMYYGAKGVALPLFNTESNVNAQWNPGTDPIIVQMDGAVFSALLLKTEILDNVNANIYFDWDASLSFETSKFAGSYGFGLIDSDNHQPWYPYYVYQMIGNNLQVGDLIVSSTNSGSVFSLAWIDKGNLNILLINTINSTVSTTVSGVSGNFNYEKIDNTYSFLNAQLQTGSLSLSSPMIMNGYTVILLTSTPTPPA